MSPRAVVIGRALRGAALLVILGVPATVTDVAAQDRFRLQLASARRLLEGGSFKQAEAVYSATLVALEGSRDSSLIAAAYFGRAFATQQRLVAGDTADRPVPLDSVVVPSIVRLKAAAVSVPPFTSRLPLTVNAGTVLPVMFTGVRPMVRSKALPRSTVGWSGAASGWSAARTSPSWATPASPLVRIFITRSTSTGARWIRSGTSCRMW